MIRIKKININLMNKVKKKKMIYLTNLLKVMVNLNRVNNNHKITNRNHKKNVKVHKKIQIIRR